MSNRTSRRIRAGLAVAALALRLAACNEIGEERPILLQKGAYAGAPDQVLSDERLDELRARTHIQTF